MILDYMTLKIIWWGLFCVICIALAITAGIDIGANLLLPTIGRNDNDRRLVLNAIGPTWEGNQVWLVLLVAGTLAIWPSLYASLLYSFYILFLFLVFGLILRPPGFDYRAKIDLPIWRKTWDLCLFLSSAMFAIALGIVVSCMFTGIAFVYDADMRVHFVGDVFSYLSPLSLLCVLITLSAFGMQGGIYLQYKLHGTPAERARVAVQTLGWILQVVFVAAIMYGGFWVSSYYLSAIGDVNSALNIFNKTVISSKIGWCQNFMVHKKLMFIPLIALVSCRTALHFSWQKKPIRALAANSTAMAAIICTAAAALFPIMLPSNVNLNNTLTVWDACASKNTLFYALIAVIIFLPIVLAYTTWVYRVMRGKVILSSESY